MASFASTEAAWTNIKYATELEFSQEEEEQREEEENIIIKTMAEKTMLRN